MSHESLPPELAALSPIQLFVLECVGYWTLEKAVAVAKDFETFLTQQYQQTDDAYLRPVCAAGLLTYGHLDLLPEVIEALPDTTTEGYIGRCVTILAHVLRVVLPLPPECGGGYRRHCHKPAVQTWFQQHQDQLEWNAQTSAFQLKSSAAD